MGTKANPGKFDCYENAEPDEPLFVLLGRDKHAPTLVWLWATLRELDGEDREVVREARQCASDMIAYAHEHGRPSVGIGQAALASVCELIRAINMFKDSAVAENVPTNLAVMRRFLAVTEFEAAEADAATPVEDAP